ncbi:MAG: thymidine kinase [Acidovorax sp.]|nr:thymidine kinase [Acidovorax sp.]
MLNNMLEFYYSTMQGGKSTALLQRRHNLISIGKRVLVLTSSLDDRYGVGKVTSRMGPQCEAQLFTHATVFDSSLPLNGIDEVFIDEAQFLRAEQVHQIHANLTSGLRIRVSCFGLRTDFRGKPFEGAATLLALADTLHEISTLCRCGAKATLNQRIDVRGSPVREGAVLEIGGDSRYRPVCPHCFYS